MAKECTEIERIEDRVKDLTEWVTQNASICIAEQKHLDEGSQERAYWHYGYLVALKDALSLLVEQDQLSRKSDMPGNASSHLLV
jgi:hypothetical protein